MGWSDIWNGNLKEKTLEYVWKNIFLKSTTQLSGAHAFRRFLRQLSTDSHETLYRTFSCDYKSQTI